MEPESEGGLSDRQIRELEFEQAEGERTLHRLALAASAQVSGASERLASGIQGLDWPFPTLQQKYGGIPYPSWSGIAAMTGAGKTSFLMSLVLEWVRIVKKVYVLPFEVDATTMRLNLAAQAAGLHPGRVAQGAWAELPLDARDRLKEQLEWQAGAGMALLRFSGRSSASVLEMQDEMDLASRWGASVVILDHFHRLEGVENYRTTAQHAKNLTELVKDYDTPLLAALQINRNEKDFFAAHQPPHFQTIQGGEVIRQESHVVLGLYRPLSAMVSRKDLVMIRSGIGEKKIGDIVKPNCVGVHLMKHRYRGELVGDTMELGWSHGRVVDPILQASDALEDRYEV
jgi:replicative DNA helicase